jgi:hypothetical protein
MFAVGGGGRPVRATGPCCCCCCGVGLRRKSDFCFSSLNLPASGVSPPYFSRSCCVELYFVAALSFSIVSSRSFCSVSRYRCVLAMRKSKYLLAAARTAKILSTVRMAHNPYKSYTYNAGPPATAAYSVIPQFCQPRTRAKMIEYSRYAKVVYRVHRALKRRACRRWLSSRVVVCVILADRVDRVFSNDAGELSSPCGDELDSHHLPDRAIPSRARETPCLQLAGEHQGVRLTGENRAK